MIIKTLPNPLYYLENFQQVLAWIDARYADLLVCGEKEFIQQFMLLPQASRAILVRMVMRKGDVFRASKLAYEEIGSAEEAVRPLTALGWVNDNPVLSLEQLFNLLRKNELASIFGKWLPDPAASKAAQLEMLAAHFQEPRRYAEWHALADEPVFQVAVGDICHRFRLMYFGNLVQDWSEFVLRDLGIFTYEKVEFTAASRGFQVRQDVDDYLHLHQCSERFHQGAAIAEVVAAIPEIAYDNAWLESRRAKLMFLIAQHCERLEEWDDAISLYQRSSYPGARMRLIRVLERAGKTDQAYDLATRAGQFPESAAESQELLRVLPRLRRKLGHPKLVSSAAAPPAVLRLLMPRPQHPVPVEILVRDHFNREDGICFYVENALVNSLFGLLCWNAVFKAVPGAFFHPFHQGPADLHRPDFHARRQQAFDDCFAELDSQAYRQTIFHHFKCKAGIESPFVFWGVLSEELLQLALDCIPAAHLKKWFTWILQDIKSNRSGFPDLIQFWPDAQRYRMIEIKGPGDRLQDNQLRWINYCAAHAMPVSVCYVEWQEAAA